jgi:hypothetical protein
MQFFTTLFLRDERQSGAVGFDQNSDDVEAKEVDEDSDRADGAGDAVGNVEKPAGFAVAFILRLDY